MINKEEIKKQKAEEFRKIYEKMGFSGEELEKIIEQRINAYFATLNSKIQLKGVVIYVAEPSISRFDKNSNNRRLAVLDENNKFLNILQVRKDNNFEKVNIGDKISFYANNINPENNYFIKEFIVESKGVMTQDEIYNKVKGLIGDKIKNFEEIKNEKFAYTMYNVGEIENVSVSNSYIVKVLDKEGNMLSIWSNVKPIYNEYAVEVLAYVRTYTTKTNDTGLDIIWEVHRKGFNKVDENYEVDESAIDTAIEEMNIDEDI